MRPNRWSKQLGISQGSAINIFFHFFAMGLDSKDLGFGVHQAALAAQDVSAFYFGVCVQNFKKSS